ncbi:Ig-like domain-containing protein [Aliikangiella sp. G2MR2-5]|uniref:Ig-like domain-containing protein n=1 Tax=Aliikangiella sp. G2MR2-5 TaxID=2788943 RepID=UPI0018AACC71|nr:Ig-like domain-containing protein [Aliikangiella sp. G2MR2-5]
MFDTKEQNRNGQQQARFFKTKNSLLQKQLKIALFGAGVSSLMTFSGASMAAERGLNKIAQPVMSKGQVIRDNVESKKYRGATLVDHVSPTGFTGDIRELPKAREWQPGDAVKVANPRKISDLPDRLPAVNSVVKTQSNLIEKQRKSAAKAVADLEVGVNVTGFDFNGVNPPDPTGEVGENYYIHSINSYGGSTVQIFNKATGEKVGNPFDMDSLATTGDCQDGLGDPVIVYDEYAKRWLLSEFSQDGPNKLCVYISRTSDPVSGGWYAYEFAAPSFPDYPKYSVWGGNYYVSANEGGGAVYALEREKMLAGESAAMVRKAVPALAGFGFQSISPIDADGANPPADGTPGLFIRHRDDELHNAGSNDGERDFLELWTFTPDFQNPDNSVLEGPQNIEVTEFDSNFNCPDGFGCLEQKPEAGQSLSTLDPLKEVVNYKPQYRNFNSHESITGSFVTKLADNNAGLRWFELRKTADEWTLHQEGIMPSSDNNSRYMSGAALDGDGNMALAYMTTGPDQFPSIRLTGRRVGDAEGTVSADEITIVEADGSIATERDGDYSQMSVDPVDNCTFWYTAEHGGAGAQWKTNVANFKFPGCTGNGSTDPGFSMSASNRSQAVCRSGELLAMPVSITGYNDFGGNVTLSYAELSEGISGDFSVNPVAEGNSSNALVTVSEGVVAGEYTFKIQGASEGVDSRELSATVRVVDSEHTSTLSSPANGAETVDYTTTLSWEDSGYVAEHTIEIATDAEFANIIATGTVASGTNYRPSEGLPQSTTLYWRVTAANACGETLSETFSFTTASDKDNAIELVPNEARAIEGSEGEYGDYYVEVPAGVEILKIKTSGGQGDVDIYVGFNKIPMTQSDVICFSEESGTLETCEIESPEPGSYFITTAAYTDFSGAELVAEFAKPNQPPVAVNDSFTVEEGSIRNPLDVMINDTDVDNDTLTLTAVDYSGGGAASIIDGKISYSPNAGFVGTEEFEYTISDSVSGTARGKVTVEVKAKPGSGGGSIGFFALILLPLLGVRRRKNV